MRSFYKAVIKHLQKVWPIEDVLLQSQSCLNPREQKLPDGLQYCKVIPREMPRIEDEDKVKVGDEWIRYQEMELRDEELELCVDHFWHRIISKIDECRDNFKALPKMVKCVLVLRHSNADVERSLSINKKMLTM